MGGAWCRRGQEPGTSGWCPCAERQCRGSRSGPGDGGFVLPQRHHRGPAAIPSCCGGAGVLESHVPWCWGCGVGAVCSIAVWGVMWGTGAPRCPKGRPEWAPALPTPVSLLCPMGPAAPWLPHGWAGCDRPHSELMGPQGSSPCQTSRCHHPGRGMCGGHRGRAAPLPCSSTAAPGVPVPGGRCWAPWFPGGWHWQPRVSSAGAAPHHGPTGACARCPGSRGSCLRLSAPGLGSGAWSKQSWFPAAGSAPALPAAATWSHGFGPQCHPGSGARGAGGLAGGSVGESLPGPVLAQRHWLRGAAQALRCLAQPGGSSVRRIWCRWPLDPCVRPGLAGHRRHVAAPSRQRGQRSVSPR